MPNTFLPTAAGFALLGLLGAATVVAAPAAPGAPAESAAPSGPPTVLLLSNGKVLLGEVSRVGPNYVVKHKIGTILKSRGEAVGAFRSIAEVYRYKVGILPEFDGDERLKLAYWCLDQKLETEAREQIGAVLALNPEDRRARAIWNSMERKTAATESATADPEVVRTSAEAVEGATPAILRLNQFREQFARNPRGGGAPVVLDLPPPLAVVRYREFGRTVHPILQARCARCHNEQSQGALRMVQARSKRDLGNDLLIRTNLDAALLLVAPDDLARSPLLSAAGMTHGDGGRPVLGGPNNPEYRALAAWVKSLKAAPEPDPATAGGPSQRAATEAFAAGRLGASADPAMPPAAPRRVPPSAPGAFEAAPPGDEPAALAEPPSSSDFPPAALPGEAVPAAVRQQFRRSGPAAAVPPGEAGVVPGGAGVVTTAADGTRIKTMPDGSTFLEVAGEFVPYNTSKTKPPADAPRRRSKIDPKILQGVLSSGRGGP